MQKIKVKDAKEFTQDAQGKSQDLDETGCSEKLDDTVERSGSRVLDSDTEDEEIIREETEPDYDLDETPLKKKSRNRSLTSAFRSMNYVRRSTSMESSQS